MWQHSGSGLATAHDDLASEVRHRGSDTGGGLSNVFKKRMFTIGRSGGGGSPTVWIILKQYLKKSVN